MLCGESILKVFPNLPRQTSLHRATTSADTERRKPLCCRSVQVESAPAIHPPKSALYDLPMQSSNSFPHHACPSCGAGAGSIAAAGAAQGQQNTGPTAGVSTGQGSANANIDIQFRIGANLSAGPGEQAYMQNTGGPPPAQAVAPPSAQKALPEAPPGEYSGLRTIGYGAPSSFQP
jgi:hypothetical protein